MVSFGHFWKFYDDIFGCLVNLENISCCNLLTCPCFGLCLWNLGYLEDMLTSCFCFFDDSTLLFCCFYFQFQGLCIHVLNELWCDFNFMNFYILITCFEVFQAPKGMLFWVSKMIQGKHSYLNCMTEVGRLLASLFVLTKNSASE